MTFRKTKLNELERKHGVPSVRRPNQAKEKLVQAVLDEAARDLAQNNSPNFVKTKLRTQGIQVPR